jgi:transposase
MENLLDADSVAKIFGVSTRTLRTWVNKKRTFLAPITSGRKPLWSPTQLADWIARDAPRRDGPQMTQPALGRRGRPRNSL